MSKYQAYPEYKDSGVEWLGSIPADWSVKRIQETALVISGYPFESKKFDPLVGTPLIRIRDIKAQKTEVFFNGEVPKEALVDSGDVLVGMDGDFNVAMWKSGLAALNQRVACLRTDDKSLQKFLFYVLPFNMKVVNDLTYFTTVKHLSNNDILKTVYALPKRAELINIVNFLDHETAKIDTLIEKQQQLIKLLKEKRQAVISHAVTKGLNPQAPMKDSGVEWLGEVPEHWDVLALRRIIQSMEQGKSPECESTPALDGQWGVLKTSCVNNGIFHAGENKALPSYTQAHTKYEVKAGDVLMSRASGSIKLIGSVAIAQSGVRDKLLLSDKVFRIHLSPKLMGEYFSYLMATPYMRTLIERAISGAEGMANNITKSSIMEFVGILPPLEEQTEIVEHINNQCKRFDEIICKAVNGSGLLQERRTALISAAVTGKIDVRNWQAPTSQQQALEQTA